MKKISIYILAMLIIFLSAEQIMGQAEGNFRYIVPMDNKKVDINYEMELILAMREDILTDSAGEFSTSYAVFDFDGNIIVDYDIYDKIELMPETHHIKATSGENIIMLDNFDQNVSFTENKYIEFNNKEADFYNHYDFVGTVISEGLICVGNRADDGRMKYGFVDMDGNVIIPIIYENPIPYGYPAEPYFGDGLCWVRYPEYNEAGTLGMKEGFINKENEIIIKMEKGAWISSGFSEGLAIIRRENEASLLLGEMFATCEYIDKTGKTVLADENWYSVGSFKNGLAVVSNRKAGDTIYNTRIAKEGVIKYPDDSVSAWAGIVDIEGHWANNSINNLVDLGIVDGYKINGRNYFKPDSNITRAECVKLFAMLAGVEIKPALESKFSDVDINDWFTPYANWSKNIVADGYEDGTFRPDNLVTREEMAVMTHNFIMNSKVEFEYFPAANHTPWHDYAEISNWALDKVKSIYYKGLIRGAEKFIYAPKENLTRAEVVNVISMLHSYIKVVLK